MKKLIISLLAVLLLSGSAFSDEILDSIKSNPLYPAEYWVTADYNPDKDRDWQFGEVSNGFKWKVKDKGSLFFTPDEYWLAWDYNPDKERTWTCQEITGGVKWNLK